jgi:hypothetical protein
MTTIRVEVEHYQLGNFQLEHTLHGTYVGGPSRKMLRAALDGIYNRVIEAYQLED